MTCRHAPNDPLCGGYEVRVAAARALVKLDDERRGDATTPDAERFEIVDAASIGTHLVLRVKYPSCATCAYEGVKVIVFLDTTSLDALKWRRLDPHFRPSSTMEPSNAPSPAARFPGSEEGWRDAIRYAQHKMQEQP